MENAALATNDDKPKNSRGADRSFTILYWTALLWMAPSRILSSFFAVSASNQTFRAFQQHYNWDSNPDIELYVGWFTFISVSYANFFSVLKRLDGFNKVRKDPEASSKLRAKIKLTVPAVAVGLAALANGASTALNTFGGSLQNLDGLINSSSSDPVPAPANMTLVFPYGSALSQSAPIDVSTYNPGIVGLSIMVSVGAALLSITYNLLAMINAKQEESSKLRKGFNFATLLYYFILLVSVPSWLVVTFYGAMLAEEQLGANVGIFEDTGNAVLAIGVAANNFQSQIDDTKRFIVKYLQSNNKVEVVPEPSEQVTIAIDQPGSVPAQVKRGLLGKSFASLFIGIAWVLAFGGNITQAVSAIGQTYGMLLDWGVAEFDAFWAALVFGSMMAFVNIIIYTPFRTAPAGEQGSLYINKSIDKCSIAYDYTAKRVSESLMSLFSHSPSQESTGIQLSRIITSSQTPPLRQLKFGVPSDNQNVSPRRQLLLSNSSDDTPRDKQAGRQLLSLVSGSSVPPASTSAQSSSQEKRGIKVEEKDMPNPVKIYPIDPFRIRYGMTMPTPGASTPSYTPPHPTPVFNTPGSQQDSGAGVFLPSARRYMVVGAESGGATARATAREDEVSLGTSELS